MARVSKDGCENGAGRHPSRRRASAAPLDEDGDIFTDSGHRPHGRVSRDEAPTASWFETRARSALLTMRGVSFARLRRRFCCLRRRFCYRIDQVDEGVADFAIPDSSERGQQFERVAVRNELGRSGTRALPGRRVGIGLEQGADRDIEYPGDLGKPPGADSVRAFLIFLYLLERDAEPAGEVALRHAQDQSMSADGLSDLDVRGIGPPPCVLHCKIHYL
jgi:hypothetical protein